MMSIRTDSRVIRRKKMNPEYVSRLKRYYRIQDAFIQKKASYTPLIIEIEPTTSCQLDCIFCPRDAIRRKSGTLLKQVFTRVLDNLGPPHEAGMLLFSGFGEPLLNKNLDDLVDYAKRQGWFCGLTTNGMAFSPSLAGRLIDAGLDVLQISLHAASASVYQQLVKKGSFIQIQEIIQSLIPLCRERIVLALNYTITHWNQKETGSFAGYWKKQGVPCINFAGCHNRGGFYQDFSCAKKAEPLITSQKCWVFKNICYVTWEGRLLACCHDITGETELGNLVLTPLEEIRIKTLSPLPGIAFTMCSRCNFSFR